MPWACAGRTSGRSPLPLLLWLPGGGGVNVTCLAWCAGRPLRGNRAPRMCLIEDRLRIRIGLFAIRSSNGCRRIILLHVATVTRPSNVAPRRRHAKGVSHCGVSVQFWRDRLFHGRRFPTSEIDLGQHVWDPCLRAKRQSPEALAIDRAPLGHTLCRPGWLPKQLASRPCGLNAIVSCPVWQCPFREGSLPEQPGWSSARSLGCSSCLKNRECQSRAFSR